MAVILLLLSLRTADAFEGGISEALGSHWGGWEALVANLLSALEKAPAWGLSPILTGWILSLVGPYLLSGENTSGCVGLRMLPAYSRSSVKGSRSLSDPQVTFLEWLFPSEATRPRNPEEAGRL